MIFTKKNDSTSIQRKQNDFHITNFNPKKKLWNTETNVSFFKSSIHVLGTYMWVQYTKLYDLMGNCVFGAGLFTKSLNNSPK